MMRIVTIVAIGSLLPACVTVGDEATQGEPVFKEKTVGEGGRCEADPARELIGTTASSDLGSKVLTATGAEVLRWLPPDSAATMDYRPDRVSVTYDRAMVVTAIRCG